MAAGNLEESRWEQARLEAQRLEEAKLMSEAEQFAKWGQENGLGFVSKDLLATFALKIIKDKEIDIKDMQDQIDGLTDAAWHSKGH